MISDLIKSKLRPWQPSIVEATVEGLRKSNGFLNASGLGSGKTYTSLATVKALDCNALFLCRLAVKETVREVATDHFGLRPHQVQPLNLEMVRTGNTQYGRWINGERDENTGKYEQIFKWSLPPDQLLIWDEIHGASGLQSLSAQMLRDAVNQGIKVLGLSGTAADHPLRMRSIGYMLGLHRDWDFWQWIALYGCSEAAWDFGLKKQFLKTRKGQEELRRKQDDAMARMHAKLVKSGRMVRLRTSEIPGFPKVSIHPMCIDFDCAELAVIFEEMRVELEELKKKGKGRTQLEIMMRARQRAELLMVPTWAEMTQDAIDEGESVVLFLNFTATVRALAERLKTDCLYTGDNLKDRAEHHRRFMADESRVIVTNLGAASESVGFQDTHGNFPRTGIISSSFWATQMNQVLGRCARDGAKSPSKMILTFPRGTIMEQAYKACKRRTELYGAFNGDVRFTDQDMQAGLPI